MIQEKILSILKNKDGYASGEEISADLKISRQGLWKHIQELRDIGYDIVAVPHLGYKILSAPDRLIPAEVAYNLNTKIIGKKIIYLENVSSTMDVAMQHGLEGCQEGAIVLAEGQTKGRGRLGRTWTSPKYKGIYLSLILKPKIIPNQAAILTLLAAVSICEAIKEITDLDAKIKWPNDIFIHHKKIGGILTELSAEADAIHFMVIGIGINVNSARDAVIPSATSLKIEKKENISRIALLQEILRRTEANYIVFQKKGWEYIIDKWRQMNITLNRRVKITSFKEHLEAEAVDIDKDGGLLVRTDAGLVQKVMAGDVMLCR